MSCNPAHPRLHVSRHLRVISEVTGVDPEGAGAGLPTLTLSNLRVDRWSFRAWVESITSLSRHRVSGNLCVRPRLCSRMLPFVRTCICQAGFMHSALGASALPSLVIWVQQLSVQLDALVSLYEGCPQIFRCRSTSREQS